MGYQEHKAELERTGFSILNDLYSNEEVELILDCIENSKLDNGVFSKTKDVYAIRQLIKNVPNLKGIIFNESLKALISNLSDSVYFLTKAIYFDKPSESNWFVSYHQDLSISVNEKAQVDNYRNWTYKKGLFGVQPPVEILKNAFTIRIHLDDTNENNGALRVIPKSHLNGVMRLDSKMFNVENEFVCKVKRGGVMLMKPLTLHASKRTNNGKRRRVIHLEFNSLELAEPLNWLEYLDISKKFSIQSQ